MSACKRLHFNIKGEQRHFPGYLFNTVQGVADVQPVAWVENMGEITVPAHSRGDPFREHNAGV